MLRLLLINDPGARNDTGRRAKQRIQDEYLWEKVAAQVEQVYLDLYGGKELPANSRDSPTLCSERENVALGLENQAPRGWCIGSEFGSLR